MPTQRSLPSRLTRLIRLSWHFLAAVVIGAFAGSLAQTQLTLRHLPSFGVDVDFPTRFASTGADLLHFAPKLAALLAAAFAIAFAANAGISYWRGRHSAALTILAGTVAVLAMLIIMRYVLGLQPISSARDALGLSCFALCGALAGASFAWLRGHQRATGNQ